eukprot:TRINITY_DN18127_c0_g1_i1.p1 TRINITY_DN18127_c0_g1~~TRINITY_DN18127_c0_g1_i1.p1  ORF type:complete len:1241 (+),score=215.05 TRINITY_DN18127_c0_g1_i1:97-3723(+)
MPLGSGAPAGRGYTGGPAAARGARPAPAAAAAARGARPAPAPAPAAAAGRVPASAAAPAAARPRPAVPVGVGRAAQQPTGFGRTLPPGPKPAPKAAAAHHGSPGSGSARPPGPASPPAGNTPLQRKPTAGSMVGAGTPLRRHSVHADPAALAHSGRRPSSKHLLPASPPVAAPPAEPSPPPPATAAQLRRPAPVAVPPFLAVPQGPPSRRAGRRPSFDGDGLPVSPARSARRASAIARAAQVCPCCTFAHSSPMWLICAACGEPRDAAERAAETSARPPPPPPQPRETVEALRAAEAACARSRKPFDDPNFPAGSLSLRGLDRRDSDWAGGARLAETRCGGRPFRADRRWKRFREITGGVAKGLGGLSASCIQQGELGDCWFLGALGVVAERPALLRRVFATEGNSEWGVHCLRFWRDGDWEHVLVDDRFPVDDSERRLAFASGRGGELWVPLVEKAYAKLHGSYRAIAGGSAFDALTDLTGAPCETVSLRSRNADGVDTEGAWLRLCSYAMSGCIMAACCGAGDDDDPSREKEDLECRAAGLVPRHCYSLLQVQDDRKYGRRLRLRNPWGQTSARAASGRAAEFWIDWDEFVCHFTSVVVCLTRQSWKSQRAKAALPPGSRASTTMRLQVTEQTWVICGIVQPDTRGRIGARYETVAVITAEDGGDQGLLPVAFAPGHASRLVTAEMHLHPGHYLIIPICPSGAPDESLHFTCCVWAAKASVKLRAQPRSVEEAAAGALVARALVTGRVDERQAKAAAGEDAERVCTVSCEGSVWVALHNPAKATDSAAGEVITQVIDARACGDLHASRGLPSCAVCVLPPGAVQLAVVLESNPKARSWKLCLTQARRTGGCGKHTVPAKGLRTPAWADTRRTDVPPVAHPIPPGCGVITAPTTLAEGVVLSCQQCDSPILGEAALALLKDGTWADLHRGHCEETFARKHAPVCVYCKQPVVGETVAALSPGSGPHAAPWAKGAPAVLEHSVLHRQCMSGWMRARAADSAAGVPTAPPDEEARCDQCGERLEGEVLSIHSENASACLHRACVPKWREQHGLRCAVCRRVVEGKYVKVSGMGVMHIPCAEQYQVDRAPKCAHCRKPLSGKYVILSDDKGEHQLHSDCADAFQLATAPACAHCGKGVLGGAVATVGGEEHRLHQHCVAPWKDSRAPQCVQCKQAIHGTYSQLQSADGKVLALHDQCLELYRNRPRQGSP